MTIKIVNDSEAGLIKWPLTVQRIAKKFSSKFVLENLLVMMNDEQVKKFVYDFADAFEIDLVDEENPENNNF